ncbi:unnamed protein product [Gongylonema pulchrum]|uniref:G_PROTEIN_RECEP_F1_2 domain-containing protein n=1 Tax=Gongylonema pulchrum TaxID=637853 RepID=A0A183E295_9BILA|nr:unnamed protein product [Gongylonema pulchrum]
MSLCDGECQESRRGFAVGSRKQVTSLFYQSSPTPQEEKFPPFRLRSLLTVTKADLPQQKVNKLITSYMKYVPEIKLPQCKMNKKPEIGTMGKVLKGGNNAMIYVITVQALQYRTIGIKRFIVAAVASGLAYSTPIVFISFATADDKKHHLDKNIRMQCSTSNARYQVDARLDDYLCYNYANITSFMSILVVINYGYTYYVLLWRSHDYRKAFLSQLHLYGSSRISVTTVKETRIDKNMSPIRLPSVNYI